MYLKDIGANKSNCVNSAHDIRVPCKCGIEPHGSKSHAADLYENIYKSIFLNFCIYTSVYFFDPIMFCYNSVEYFDEVEMNYYI